MSIQSTRNRFLQLLSSLGKATLHHQFPNEFEYYLVSLELVNSKTGSTEDLLVFPVMPDSIRIRKHKITNIQKSSSGIIVTHNPTFNPVEISISGTFGRKFKFLLNENDTFFGEAFSLTKENNGIKNVDFNRSIKTGYGVTKELERIFDKYGSNSNGDTYKLFFYNLAFNSNYLVEPLEVSFSQTKETNMLWQYNMAFKGVAPASQVRSSDDKTYLHKMLMYDNLQKGLNVALDISKEQNRTIKTKLMKNLGLVENFK